MASKETLQKVENLFKKYKEIVTTQKSLESRRLGLKTKILKIMGKKDEVTVGAMMCKVSRKKRTPVIDVSALYDHIYDEPIEVFLTLINPNLAAINIHFDNKIPGELIEKLKDAAEPSVTISHV